MTITTLFSKGRSQAVRLPKEFRFSGTKVSIRRLGHGIFLEPVEDSIWPEHYFEDIQITDDAFSRPEQGLTPPSPRFE